MTATRDRLSILLASCLRRLSNAPTSTGAASVNSSEAGVSLIECLVGIVVIGLTASLILPPLFVAAASRVQNRRADQAFQLSQAEVDRIQAMVTRGRQTAAVLPTATTTATGAAVPKPNGAYTQMKSVVSTCNTYVPTTPVPLLQALPIDIDGLDTNGDGNRCEADFYMQVFRLSRAGEPDPPNTFTMGVRVYSKLVEGNWANLQTTPAAIQITSGEGSQRVRPLVVLYPTVTRGDQSGTLCELHRSLGSASPPCI